MCDFMCGCGYFGRAPFAVRLVAYSFGVFVVLCAVFVALGVSGHLPGKIQKQFDADMLYVLKESQRTLSERHKGD